MIKLTKNVLFICKANLKVPCLSLQFLVACATNSQTLTLILFLPINPALGNSATELSYHPNAEYL